MSVREAWILAGTLDGVAGSPMLVSELGGIPYLTRLVCDAASAGAKTVYVVWCGDRALPDITAIAADPRITSRVSLSVVRTPPEGPATGPVLVLRADRVYQRDVPKLAAAAWNPGMTAAKVAGCDVAIVTTHATAVTLCAAAAAPGGLDAAIATLATTEAPLPYMGFCMPARDRRGLRAAEKQLVRSLRKSADGIAAKLINRRISLPITRLLAGTPLMPNHVTLIALVLALSGGAVIARGGWLAGVIGMLLVEFGSIVDGIDGELARLRFQFSRKGQWLDTVVDDLANLAYATGVSINLSAAGASWALPLGITAMSAFLLTQATQYWLIFRVYGSGDLAAIPWAFQSSEFLSQRPRGLWPWLKATVPKMLKRDIVVSMFLILAIASRLDVVLYVFSGGAFVFFVVLFTQLVRNRASVQQALRKRR